MTQLDMLACKPACNVIQVSTPVSCTAGVVGLDLNAVIFVRIQVFKSVGGACDIR